MSNKPAAPVDFYFIADGSSLTASFDLDKDPGFLPRPFVNVLGKGDSVVVGASTDAPNYSVSVSGHVLTATYTTAPPAGPSSISVYLVF